MVRLGQVKNPAGNVSSCSTKSRFSSRNARPMVTEQKRHAFGRSSKPIQVSTRFLRSGILFDMRSRINLLLLSVILFSVLAAAQTTPKPDESDSLFFVKIAANVASNLQHDNLNGYLGIYISEKNWNAALKDGDLGPFLKPQEAKAGRSAACVFSSMKDAATCVYFDGKSPYGEVSAKAGTQGGLQAVDLAAAYKPVSKEMLKKGDHDFRFTEGAINTDDGTPLPGYAIEQ